MTIITAATIIGLFHFDTTPATYTGMPRHIYEGLYFSVRNWRSFALSDTILAARASCQRNTASHNNLRSHVYTKHILGTDDDTVRSDPSLMWTRHFTIASARAYVISSNVGA